MKNSYVLSRPPAEVEIETITDGPIDLPAMLAKGHDPKAGAVVLFSGEVRNHSKGRAVLCLEYEAYEPMAKKVIQKIIDDARQKFNLHTALCVHRIGLVNICESAVVVVTSSSHREEAYAANKYIIDRVKHEAPIWKREFFEDGTNEWGHGCNCHNH